MAEYDKKTADKIAAQARQEYQSGLLYRKDRENAWKLVEDFYFNKVQKSLKGKFNVPVPILPGFVDTWQSNMSRHVDLKFKPPEPADYRAAKKVTSFYTAIRNKDDYDWDMADTDGKKMACLSGRAIYKYYAQSKPQFKSSLLPVDHYDFIVSPSGGGDIERHLFVMEDNVFRGKEDLKDGVEMGLYDKSQVEKLINATKDDTLIDNDNIYRSKQNRYMALGMDGVTYNYAGQSLYKFVEAGTTYKGKRYYILFNYETGLWVRCQPLEEVFESKLWWFTSWATHRDTFNFWSKSPSDDMVPMAEMIRILVNQEFDNRNKRNYGQRAYDPEIFPNPEELEWRPDGLVTANSKLGAKRIADGIYQFETPELQGTINLVNWIDNMLKEKTGVNAESQGQSNQDKVGIAYLNVQQSAKRTALVYEAYTKCWQAIGRRFLWGLTEHMRKPEAVKIIGENGEEWDKLARTEIDPNWDILIEGGDEQAAQDEIKKKSLQEFFNTLQQDELAQTSPKWRFKTKAMMHGLDEDDIREAFDLQGDSTKDATSMASKMIQDVLNGKKVRPYLGATTVFLEKIMDYAYNTDLEDADREKLLELFTVHEQIAAENMARRAFKERIAQGGGVPQEPQEPQVPATEQLYSGASKQPASNTQGGTISRSQDMTQLAPQPYGVT